MGAGSGIAIAVIVVAVYFLPNWVAISRDHPNKSAIGWLNLLAGWTFLGWIAALIWSLTVFEQKPATAATDDTMPCPYCAETIKRAARICRYCQKELP